MSDTTDGNAGQGALRSRLGGAFGQIDTAAIARAEAALKSLSANFAQWLDEEVAKLDAARERLQAQGPTSEAMETLYLRAHDMKGLGATYEYPIVSRIAGSLCRLIDDPAKRAAAPMFLVDAHIDAIKAAVKGGIQNDAHPAGRALVTELESQVKAIAGR